jgi:hypothetical protein
MVVLVHWEWRGTFTGIWVRHLEISRVLSTQLWLQIPPTFKWTSWNKSLIGEFGPVFFRGFPRDRRARIIGLWVFVRSPYSATEPPLLMQSAARLMTFRGVRWTKSVTVPRFLFHTSPMAVFDLVAQKQGWIVAACALVAFLQPYSRGSWYLNLLNGLYTSSLFAVIFNIWPFLLCKSFYSVP